MVFARRASPCSSLPTLPGAASAVLASSPGDGCFFHFSLVKYLFRLQASIHTYRYVPISVYLYKRFSGVAGRSLSLRPRRPWSESRMSVLSFVCAIFIFVLFQCVKICTMMIEGVV